MLADVYQETKERMDKAIGNLLQELNAIRTGRANPSLVELLPIEYYGTQTPLQELAGISVPESRSLLIRPYDPSSLKNIEKAILKSDLGLTPNNDGENIRLVLPTGQSSGSQGRRRQDCNPQYPPGCHQGSAGI